MLQQAPTTRQPTNLQLKLPLEPTTDNAEHVAQSLHRLLGVADELHSRLNLSESDLVQAMTLATAFRAAMAEMDERGSGALPTRLLDIEVQADSGPHRA